MIKTIDMEQLKKDAVEVFHNGFTCSESVIYAIRKHFELNLPDDVIAMSSGFPWGLGGAGCICGALAGGTMCLGYFFGRRTPGEPVDKCFQLTQEFHDY
ncbi:MAG: C-GCAxxG-C-C family (seleno)protein, partial [Bacillota bacterium]|nr:C-GCAxxG-C-C family (seleno)protein [Bacillota bacterium]